MTRRRAKLSVVLLCLVLNACQFVRLDKDLEELEKYAVISGVIRQDSPNDNAMFWGGAGGSTIVVDQQARVCLSYVMNQMKNAIVGDQRGGGLGKAFYDSL